MGRRARSQDWVVLLLSTLFIHLILNLDSIDTGATPNSKNLVNLYTNSPNDPNFNLTTTGLNQFQNDHQFRHGSTKQTYSERNKTPTPPSSSQPSPSSQFTTTSSSASSSGSGISMPSSSTNPDSVYEHLLSDSSGYGSPDYSYSDSHTNNNKGISSVPECKGRLKLNGTSGYITDGPGSYQTNLQCVWIIDSGHTNATVRIQFHQFNTECNYDYLYIFDGDSIYSPLVVALSGDMKDFNSIFAEERLEGKISNETYYTKRMNYYNETQTLPPLLSNTDAIVSTLPSESRTFEIKTQSGKAFIYFHSDTAQSMPGFYMTYSINSCPLDCSNRGVCDYSKLTCKCDAEHFGHGCQYTLCPNNCTSVEHGLCDMKKSCICASGYYGHDCSMSSDRQLWLLPPADKLSPPPKAFHQSLVVDDIMWVFGGKSQALSNMNFDINRQKKTTLVIGYDLKLRRWIDTFIEGTTGVDHLAELSGHSVAAKGHKLFVYGGMSMNNTVLDALTVFDTRTQTLSSLNTKTRSKSVEDELVPPIAVTGHSANIVGSHMFIFLGYSPLYGYINLVQKFNIANNTWSIVDKKGCSMSGFIGHTSTYDPNTGLVYIYGGHHSHRLNSLYSFDPDYGTWTLLRAGPSPRYFHSTVLINDQLIILGGNSYNTSHQSDQCFQQTYLVYDLACGKSKTSSQTSLDKQRSFNPDQTGNTNCGQSCWQSFEGNEPHVMKRHGHSVVTYNNALILFGGFNGFIMNELRILNITTCSYFSHRLECIEPKLGLECYWLQEEEKCVEYSNKTVGNNTSIIFDGDIAAASSAEQNCTKREQASLQQACEAIDTCNDCLNTNLGCVWCGFLAQCQYRKCKSLGTKAISQSDMCYSDEYPNSALIKAKLGLGQGSKQIYQELDNELDCKRSDNCYLCYSKPHCSWEDSSCTYIGPNIMNPQTSGPSSPSSSPSPSGNLSENNLNEMTSTQSNSSSNQMIQGSELFDRFFLAAITRASRKQTPSVSASNICAPPCYMRKSCQECSATKCIWCSTTEQCVDSSAYFAYHGMGQCMHYVAHMLKCPVATCADIETCDKCLANPKCGWLNDISNTGKGRCIEGTSAGPALNNKIANEESDDTLVGSNSSMLNNWFFTNCPTCQCNGHSSCKQNTTTCIQPCQDNTEGPFCERCASGYFGHAINGGICRPCRCNGHAQSCNKETGKCYCSTKGITGHNCNRCDDQYNYVGDPSSGDGGTCSYNLTTDYQYTFNMSKPEDHFYTDINFINVPHVKDSDIDFTIACSRTALVNITTGSNFKKRKFIHSSMECGSFRLRFPQIRHLNVTNYSIFVQVYNFQTPFIIQITFSQHRTLFLPQLFFTFSSAFLFFFALSGVVWKVKHEIDLYVRRQRQFIEMEQMASRPFSTIMLEVHRKSPEKPTQTAEPTPISFEPCFGSNVGVLSMFVQLPGKPNLAIGSALVSLSDDAGSGYFEEDANSEKRQQKDQTCSSAARDT